MRALLRRFAATLIRPEDCGQQVQLSKGALVVKVDPLRGWQRPASAGKQSSLCYESLQGV